jgi:hypothetical protein
MLDCCLKNRIVFIIFFIIVLALLAVGYLFLSAKKIGTERPSYIPDNSSSFNDDRIHGVFSTPSDGLKRVWLSGIITEEPYEEMGIFLVPISFDEKRLGDHNFLALGKRENELGFNMVRNGQTGFPVRWLQSRFKKFLDT